MVILPVIVDLLLVHLMFMDFMKVDYLSLMLPSVTLHHLMCSRKVKTMSTIPQLFFTNHVILPCVSIQCWILSSIQSYINFLSLFFVNRCGIHWVPPSYKFCLIKIKSLSRKWVYEPCSSLGLVVNSGRITQVTW